MTLEKDLLLGFIQMFCLVALAVIVISVVVRHHLSGMKKQIQENSKLLRDINKKVIQLNKKKNFEPALTSAPSQPVIVEEALEEVEESQDEGISPDVKLYVGNIDYSVTEVELEDLFNKFGEIEMVNIPVHRHSGKTRGFGFVTFNTVESAANALTMNGTEFKGRSLQINYAKSKA